MQRGKNSTTNITQFKSQERVLIQESIFALNFHYYIHLLFKSVKTRIYKNAVVTKVKGSSMRRSTYFLFLSFIFTALHAMQTRSSDENSVCPSVRLSVCPSVCPSVKRVHCDKTEESCA